MARAPRSACRRRVAAVSLCHNDMAQGGQRPALGSRLNNPAVSGALEPRYGGGTWFGSYGDLGQISLGGECTVVEGGDAVRVRSWNRRAGLRHSLEPVRPAVRMPP